VEAAREAAGGVPAMTSSKYTPHHPGSPWFALLELARWLEDLPPVTAPWVLIQPLEQLARRFEAMTGSSGHDLPRLFNAFASFLRELTSVMPGADRPGLEVWHGDEPFGDQPAAPAVTGAQQKETVMPRVSEIYAGQYLNASELLPLGKRHPALIHDVREELVGQDRTARIVISLTSRAGRAWPRDLVCNKGNATILANAYGDNTDEWIGKGVELFAETVQYQGKPVPGIRLMPVAQKPVAQKPAMPASEPAAAASDPLLDDEIPF
jgi:hypothetical protein